MIDTKSKINLSKIGWEGGGSTSIWIMSRGGLDGNSNAFKQLKQWKQLKLVKVLKQ